MRVAELKAIARERGLRGYSRLRKAELIALLRDNLQPSTRPLCPAGEAPLSSPRRLTQPRQPSIRFRPDRPRQPELLRKLEGRNPQPPLPPSPPQKRPPKPTRGPRPPTPWRPPPPPPPPRPLQKFEPCQLKAKRDVIEPPIEE